MLMPALLPESLAIYQVAETETKLLEMLEGNPIDLVYFFETCCDDETWCITHPGFIKKILTWLTGQVFSNKLRIFYGRIAAKAIQKHFQNLMLWIPQDIIFEFADGKRVINSLLFQGISPFFHSLIQVNCFEKNENTVSLTSMSLADFSIIQEYVYTGRVKELWRLQESEILRILQLARVAQLPELTQLCEELYLRYISVKNYMDYVALSGQQGLELVRRKCCELFNSLQSAVIVSPEGSQGLIFELTISTATTLEQLKVWSRYVTHFIAGVQVMEDLDVTLLLQQCPRLQTIDIGKTREFSSHFLQIRRFKELVLSGCLWLQDQSFKKIVSAFPQLEKLDLTSCSQISPLGWGELTKLPRLSSLNLSRSDALDDETFGLILASARHLHELVLNECRGLTKASFHALAMSKQPLERLGLGRTGIDDANLLEITLRLQSLSSIDLTRCQNLTEQGIFDALKIAPSLSEVCLVYTEIGGKAIEDLRRLKPHLKIL